MVLLQSNMMSQQVVSLVLVLLFCRSEGAPHLSQFSSHVSFATPAGSFHHGVGNPQPPPLLHTRTIHGNFRQKLPKLRYNGYRSLKGIPDETIYFKGENVFQGYPRERPAIPFRPYSVPYGHGSSVPYHAPVSFGDNNLGHIDTYTLPVLPPSPYRVDSPNAESLWPEGLFIPPSVPFRYGIHEHKNDPHNNFIGLGDSGEKPFVDPYFLDGIDAVRALARIKAHGELFFHEIPHTTSLLANQEMRIANGLIPHRLGSIRKTSSWYRT